MNKKILDYVSVVNASNQGVGHCKLDDLTSVAEKNSISRSETLADIRIDYPECGICEHLNSVREEYAQIFYNETSEREKECHEAENLKLASDKHICLLQEANTNLVIATIKAQELSEQLQITKNQLEEAKLTAEIANQAKSDFLSKMSHELRTPLNAILGFSQLMAVAKEPLPTDTQLNRIHQITKAGWYLLEIINEILDIAMIESGKLSLMRESVLLIDVLQECQTMVELQAKESLISIKIDEFDYTWRINADRTRLKQVLCNLFSNAIKYNRSNELVLVTCKLISQERIRITIKDSGLGLSPEKLDQLFQPFNRLGQETTKTEGTGLGLVVSKQLIELMGGKIGVNSLVGSGSEFYMELSRVISS